MLHAMKRIHASLPRSLKRALSNFWQWTEHVTFHCKTTVSAMVKSCKKTINREEEGTQPQALEAKVETINTATGIESAQEAAQRDLRPTQHYPCDSGGMIQYKN
jgi:hypothetical protein